jgi:hypothetical protein
MHALFLNFGSFPVAQGSGQPVCGAPGREDGTREVAC